MKVISGGQSGADKAALLAARACGLETGGWAPRGYRTERGHDDSLKGFGLVETPGAGYEDRTRRNVKDADCTLILSSTMSSGTKMTERVCRGMNKPFVIIDPFRYDSKDLVLAFLDRHKPLILNVAGNRESVNPGCQGWIYNLLREVFNAYSH